MLIQILVEIVIGALCGFAASKLMKVDGKSLLFYIIVGVIGGAVGGLLGNLIKLGGGWVMGIIFSIIGSCLVVWLYKKLFRK
ncbi:MAG: GlsB/YeaQ/YmgE family stress response membrane protein [Clostridia bacterium]|nr:GlsB/YeaQ/YmgE family stress response membrane protein [Clostridia bacterium]